MMSSFNFLLLLALLCVVTQCSRDQRRQTDLTLKEEASIITEIGLMIDFDPAFFADQTLPMDITKKFEDELRWLQQKHMPHEAYDWYFDGDGWKRAYKIMAKESVEGTFEVSVHSSGPDGIWSTHDDIIQKASYRPFKK